MLRFTLNTILGIFRWARRSILLIGCVFFFATTVFTLTSALVQSALAASLGMLGISSVYSALESTVKKKSKTIRKQKVAIKKFDADLQEASKGKTQLLEKNEKLTRNLGDEKTRSGRLETDLKSEENNSKKLASDRDFQKRRANGLADDKKTLQATNAKSAKTIRSHRAAVRSIGGRVTRRTLRSAALNVSSIPFESAPIIGAGVVVSITAYELHMTCDSIDDMNKIYREMGIEPEEDPGFSEKTCAGYIGKLDDLIDSANKTFNMKRIKSIVDELLADINIGG